VTNYPKIRQRIAEITGLGRTGRVATGGSTTTAVDSKLASYARDVGEGSPIYVTADAAGALPQGTQAWGTDFDRDTGTITFSPALTTLAAGDVFEVWDKAVEDIGNVNAAVAQALRTYIFRWGLTPLGILTDGDCQKIDGWTNGSNATASVAAHAYPNRLGRYFLRNLTTAADAYIYQRFTVEENQEWEIAALIRAVATGTVAGYTDIVVYDHSNGATITTDGDDLQSPPTETSGIATDWVLVRASFTVPDNCRTVELRLRETDFAGRAEAAFICVWPRAVRALPVPDRVKNLDDLGKVYRWSEKADPETPATWQPVEISNAWPVRDGYTGLSVHFNGALSGYGPFLVEERQFYDNPGTDWATAISLTISTSTNATPIAVTTSAAHSLVTGDLIYISGVTGNTNANGLYTITVTSTTTFTLDGSTGNGTHGGSGVVKHKAATIGAPEDQVAYAASILLLRYISRRQRAMYGAEAATPWDQLRADIEADGQAVLGRHVERSTADEGVLVRKVGV